MNLVHLTSSIFFGGPERQMLGLAETLPDSIRTTFISFREDDRCHDFLDVARSRGFDAIMLESDFPKVRAAIRELTAALRNAECDLLLCHGYKANLLGRVAARRLGIPVIAVSRGWTGENRKVRAYEWVDRRHMRFMDRVIAVSEGQAAKVRNSTGVPEDRLDVIYNSSRIGAFANVDPNARQNGRRKLLEFFPSDNRVSQIVVSAARLSPEKGFQVLFDAAVDLCRNHPNLGIAVFGKGAYRPVLERRITELGLNGRVVLCGFRDDLDTMLPGADVFVLPSFTEGMPNVVLEACAAGVPVVATAVGGTPEVLVEGETGFIVPPHEPAPLGKQIDVLLRDAALRSRMGEAGRKRMREMFTFDAQAAAYLKLFATLSLAPVNVPA